MRRALVTIHPPTLLDVVVAVSKAVCAEYPEATVTAGPNGEYVIEIEEP